MNAAERADTSCPSCSFFGIAGEGIRGCAAVRAAVVRLAPRPNRVEGYCPQCAVLRAGIGDGTVHDGSSGTTPSREAWSGPRGPPRSSPRADAVGFYLFKDLLPAGLTAIYPRWDVDGSSLAAWVPLLLLIGGVAALWMRRNAWGRAPFFAAAYFLIGLLPVLGFLKMSFMPLSLVSDHFQYLAMIGITVLAGAF